MPIHYKVVKCKNPKYPEIAYYNARAVKAGDYSFDELADDIAESTTVTRADTYAVLQSIRPKLKKALLAGQRVVIDGLGAFNIGLYGKCYNAETMQREDFAPSSFIKGWSLHFRPEVKLKKELGVGFQLKRLSSDAME